MGLGPVNRPAVGVDRFQDDSPKQSSPSARTADSISTIITRKNSKGVFVGDSNTDWGRTKSSDPRTDLGDGYVARIQEYLTQQNPEASLRILNRGISGDMIHDIQKRWSKDVLLEGPDWISVAVGVNDSLFRPGQLTEFESGYRDILTRARKANPSVGLVLCECYLVGDGPESRKVLIVRMPLNQEGRQALREEVSARNRIIRGLANEFGATLVPLEELLRANPDLDKYPSPAEADGVHPSRDGGHMRIAKSWLEATGITRFDTDLA